MLYDLTDRTPGEEAWVRRKARGLTQAEEAARLGVSRTTVWAIEHGLIALKRRGGALSPPMAVLLGLARRRSGLGLAGVARGIGASRRTVLIWERAADPRLVRFWRDYGFTFVK